VGYAQGGGYAGGEQSSKEKREASEEKELEGEHNGKKNRGNWPGLKHQGPFSLSGEGRGGGHYANKISCTKGYTKEGSSCAWAEDEARNG